MLWTIDSDYRGEIGVILINHVRIVLTLKGMRIAQIIFQKLPEIEIIESETLTKTDRDKGGLVQRFGLSGGSLLKIKKESLESRLF